MPSNFPNINNGDLIDESHIDRSTVPINNLESGATWYRDDTGTANAVKVNFATGNVVSSYTPGLIVHVKVAATNTGAATLTITGPSGDLSAIPLVKKGGMPLAAGDIAADQVIAAIYAEDSPGVDGRFEVLGGLSSGGLTSPVAIADGGTGATTVAGARTNLDVPSNSDLSTGLAGKANASHTHAASDITSGQLGLARGGSGADLSATGGAGQVVKQTTSGGAFTVGALAASEMPSGIDAAKVGSGDVSNTEFGYLDGVTGAIQTQLDGKQDQANVLDEISSLTLTKGDILVHDGIELNRLDVGSNGQVLSVDSAEATGLKWVAQSGGLTSPVGIADGGTGATTAAGARTSLDVPSNSDLSTGLAGKANSSHTHAASDITSGQMGLAQGGSGADLSATGGAGQVVKQTTSGGAFTVGALSASEMPSGIDATKVGSGDVSNTEFGYLDGVTGAIQTQLDGKAASSHTHAASDITSGQLGLARGGSGADLSASGGAGQVVKQTSVGGAFTVGALSASEMPSGIDAAKVGSGDVSNTEFGYLDGVTSAIQTQLDGKAASVHTHAASDITSGQLGLARGGTGADLSTTGGAGQVLKQSTSGGAVSVGVLAAGDLPTHTHAAGDITSGTLALNRGGTGANLSATGGTGQVLKQTTSGGGVTVGALTASEMPSGIDAAKIGGGSVNNTEFGYLNGVTSAIQTQLSAKADNSHTHPASAITSGTLGVARGGTGLSSFTSAGRLLYSSSTAGITSLGTGSSGQVLMSTGSGPQWNPPSALDFGNSTVSCGNVTAESIPIYSSSGGVLYAYTTGASKGMHHHWTSSRRFKMDIRSMEKVKDRLTMLEPVRYLGTAPALDESGELVRDDSGQVVTGYEDSFGLIAEDVKEVFPDLVFEVPLDDGTTSIGVHYDRLPIYQIQALKELQAEFDALKTRLALLESAK